jgi:hypothetical protein
LVESLLHFGGGFFAAAAQTVLHAAVVRFGRLQLP